jgi:hypothetical protein
MKLNQSAFGVAEVRLERKTNVHLFTCSGANLLSKTCISLDLGISLSIQTSSLSLYSTKNIIKINLPRKI